jgi:CheY-like chemotaxis protein
VIDPAAPHRHTVLLIEDHDDTRTAFVALAETKGFTAVGYASAEAALGYLERGGEACIILLDLYMPEMDGFEFRRRQLRDPSIADIPVVVTSGAPQPEVKAARALGLDIFLQKPVDIDRLLGLVARYCERTATDDQVT